MTLLEIIARFDKYFRPLALLLSPKFAIDTYSRGRHEFIKSLSKEKINNPRYKNKGEPYVYRGIKFGNRLFNAAGMFKSAYGYDISYKQGAGAFLAGSTTATARAGNSKNGIRHPFMPYPRSGAALNWLGLPNDSHETVAERISKINKQERCPIGVSISASPGLEFEDMMSGVITGMRLFAQAGADFLEFNESCPNTEERTDNSKLLDEALIERLEYVSNKYIKKNKSLPVIVKFSTDTDISQIPELVKILIEMDYGGVNFGNTSINYSEKIKQIDIREIDNFLYFIRHFGGGISGRPIKQDSLLTAQTASNARDKYIKDKEFIVIRTGGIESAEDYHNSIAAGVDLMQWFTGYFEKFAIHGHDLYKKFFRDVELS